MLSFIAFVACFVAMLYFFASGNLFCKDICWRCDLQDAKDEFWRVFEEETWLGRMLVKFLDWLENILSRRR